MKDPISRKVTNPKKKLLMLDVFYRSNVNSLHRKGTLRKRMMYNTIRDTPFMECVAH